MYEWANVTKAELDNVDASGNKRKPIASGKYSAQLTGVLCGKSKGGAFGVVFSYTIDDGPEKGRTVKEGIYLTKRDGNPIPFGPNRLKRRLMNLGLSAEAINTFKFPKKETELGDFKHLLDAHVIITLEQEAIKEGEMKGMLVARVVQVAKAEATAKDESVA